jgi:hypothetical protein
MPWVVGIDEAGYGPNLGPLVQAAVALRLPDCDHAGWDTLRPIVRRCCEKADGRLLVDDSKAVYTRYGLAALERGVLAVGTAAPDVAALARQTLLASSLEDLAAEVWFRDSDPIPVVAERESIPEDVRRFCDGAASDRGPRPRFGDAVASVVPAARFNRVCDECGSKGVVLGKGIVDLVPAALAAIGPGDEPVVFQCDKLGGRNYYGAMLQEAFPDGWIIPERECAGESRYRVELLDRPVTVVFRPRSDAESVAVALASMLCKYLREVCMIQFNRFWATHVPGIKPTAGYPGDARRFFDEIRPKMAELGLADDQVWRKR